MKKLNVLFGVLLLLSLTATLAFAQTGIGWFYIEDDLWVKDDVRIRGTTTMDTGLEVDDITLSDDLTVADDATVTDDLTVVGDLTLSPSSAETIGYDEQIDPTASFHKITAAAARGTDNIAIGTAGDVLVLLNVGSNTITLTDTGTLLLSGNAALGQNDSIVLLSDGTSWYQIAPEGDN